MVLLTFWPICIIWRSFGRSFPNRVNINITLTIESYRCTYIFFEVVDTFRKKIVSEIGSDWNRINFCRGITYSYNIKRRGVSFCLELVIVKEIWGGKKSERWPYQFWWNWEITCWQLHVSIKCPDTFLTCVWKQNCV